MKNTCILLLTMAIAHSSICMNSALMPPPPSDHAPVVSIEESASASLPTVVFFNCVELGKTETCKTLLAKHPALMQATRNGKNALHIAVDGAFQRKNLGSRIVETLLLYRDSRATAAIIGGKNYPTIRDYIEEKKKDYPLYAVQDNYRTEVNKCLFALMIDSPDQRRTAAESSPKGGIHQVAKTTTELALPMKKESTEQLLLVQEEPTSVSDKTLPESEIEKLFIFAYHGNSYQLNQLIIKHGKDIIHKSHRGRTVLHAAIQGAFKETNRTQGFIQLLENHGANPQATMVVEGKEYSAKEYCAYLIQIKYADRWNAALSGSDQANTQWRKTIEDVCYPLIENAIIIQATPPSLQAAIPAVRTAEQPVVERKKLEADTPVEPAAPVNSRKEPKAEEKPQKDGSSVDGNKQDQKAVHSPILDANGGLMAFLSTHSRALMMVNGLLGFPFYYLLLKTASTKDTESKKDKNNDQIAIPG